MRVIDADALKQKATMVTKQYKQNAIMERPAILLEDVDEAPTIDAEPISHGKWIPYGDCGVTECSCCGWNIEECVGWNYCPNCGARMDKAEE